jgi:hypothetical protein
LEHAGFGIDHYEIVVRRHADQCQIPPTSNEQGIDGAQGGYGGRGDRLLETVVLLTVFLVIVSFWPREEERGRGERPD